MSSNTLLQRHPLAMTEQREANLDNLASELLLLIASQISDLVSLDSLLRASPAFFRLFEENAVEMTEAVLSFGHTHRHIQVIIRIVALIRSFNIPAPNLTYFKQWATEHAMHNRLTPSKSAIAPLYLAKNTTPEVLRQIFATNRKITSLALDCLKFYLARFETLKPDHPINENIYPVEYRSTNVQGKRFLTKESGPPDWVEEQRVTRAFWRIQLVYDLKQAASSLPWPEDDITTLHKIHPMQMYLDVAIRPCRYSEETEAHPEYQQIYSIFDYVHDAHGENAKRASAFKSTALVHGEVCRQWPAPTPGKDSWQGLSYASGACQFYQTYHNYWKPGVQFELFRHWGFAFWNFRMFSAGFLRDWRVLPPNGRNNYEVYMFAWESILPVGDPSIFINGDFRLPSTAATPGI